MTRKLNILLVEDDRAVRDALGQALRFEQFHVVRAANSREAMREYVRNTFDAVVLDVHLGAKESGWDLFQAFRDLKPGVRILVMSGHPEEFRHTSARQATALLEKPIDLPVLFRNLRDHSTIVPAADYQKENAASTN